MWLRPRRTASVDAPTLLPTITTTTLTHPQRGRTNTRAALPWGGRDSGRSVVGARAGIGGGAKRAALTLQSRKLDLGALPFHSFASIAVTIAFFIERG